MTLSLCFTLVQRVEQTLAKCVQLRWTHGHSSRAQVGPVGPVSAGLKAKDKASPC